MTDALAIALVGSIPGTLAALGVFYNIIISNQRAKLNQETLKIAEDTKKDISTLVVQTNHIKDQLVLAERAAAESKGHEAGRLLGKQEAGAAQELRNAQLAPSVEKETL